MSAMLEPLAAIKLSPLCSCYGIVKAVEDLLMIMPRTMITEHGEVATIFVVQGLCYATHITGDPWSKFFPKKEEVIESVLKFARVQVVLETP